MHWRGPSDNQKKNYVYIYIYIYIYIHTHILTNRPDIATDMTVINQVKFGSNHRLVMIKQDVEVERKNNYDQEATKSRRHTNRIKEDRILT